MIYFLHWQLVISRKAYVDVASQFWKEIFLYKTFISFLLHHLHFTFYRDSRMELSINYVLTHYVSTEKYDER